MKLGFLGFGLIGGSIARSLKNKKPNIYIQVYARRENKELALGVDACIIDNIVYEIDGQFTDCDIIFLCAPVLANIAFLKILKSQIKPSCIITDVGSVKGNIHNEVTRLGLDANFIGGHPMAGSEKTGFENASVTLLENAYYLLTPTSETKQVDLDSMKSLIEMIGSVCVILSPSQHDTITAAISHVPHIIATTLVNLVRKNDTSDNMKNFAAGGFKDITRIASSSPEMWQNIVLSNADSIQYFIKEFIDLLNEFLDHLVKKEEDSLRESFQQASDYRDALPSTKSSILARCYELFVDIADETGAIATIATLLAKKDISIKNIGIINNREFADGVLRIELYNENAATNTAKHLLEHGYIVFERK